MALSKDIVDATLAAARENRIEPAALLAVVEIESAGQPLEVDGVTPRFLFEKHKFGEELSLPRAKQSDPEWMRKMQQAKKAGLVRSGWAPGKQYAGQDTSAGRLKILAEAASIDEECALSACSWGIGQVMGSNAESLGYLSAADMVATMKRGGIAAQVDSMVRYIRTRKLAPALARRDWAAFARGYNGKGYAKNKYDTKLAAAYAKWVARYPERAAPVVTPAPDKIDIAQMGDSGALIEGYQKRLADLGYAVGTINGEFSSRTRAAVLAFQAENSLDPIDGKIGPDTRAALNSPDARPMPIGERGAVTADDLAKSGSGTIIDSRAAGAAAKVIVTTSVATGVQETTDVLGKLQDWVGEVTSIRGVLDPAIVLLKWSLEHWWIFAAVAAVIIMRKTNAIERARVIAHRLGQHLGR